MEDSPRYVTVPVSDADNPDESLRTKLRPGDRIVSIFPVRVEPKQYSAWGRESGGVELRALIELRHPSWAKAKIGWVAGDLWGDDDY